jgi:hypothetical protein
MTLLDEDIETLIQPHIEKLSEEFAVMAAFRTQRDAEAEVVPLDEVPAIQLDEEADKRCHRSNRGLT